MSKGNGLTLELPSGNTISASSAYRYVLAIDAGEGSWVELRAKTAGPIGARVRRASPVLRGRAYVFDTETGERASAVEYL